MPAMFSFSLGGVAPFNPRTEPGTMEMALATKAALLRNWRRERVDGSAFVFMGYSNLPDSWPVAVDLDQSRLIPKDEALFNPPGAHLESNTKWNEDSPSPFPLPHPMVARV
jgi:hypothetical protein